MMSTSLARILIIFVTTTLALAGATQPAASTPDNYTPRAGVKFNSPVGPETRQRKVFRHILRSIDSVPRKGNINILTWNVITGEGVDALLRAQRRNVRVRLLMSHNNYQWEGVRNESFARLQAGLSRGNKGREKSRRSWARVCQRSCRGSGGTAHAKYYIFSRVGKARQVVIQGSANFTAAATENQWNDVFTYKNRLGPYRFYLRMFRQAMQDQPRPDPYAAKTFGTSRLMMFPRSGPLRRDPLLRTLRSIRCKRARNTTSGRTDIIIAPDVWRQRRGTVLAEQVRYLWDMGCNVRIGYTIMGIDQGRLLQAANGRGPVPMRQLAADYDGDGDFDKYFHMKSMAVRGNIAGNRSAHLVFNGSANWSGVAGQSDENMGVERKAAVEEKYTEHLNYWYDNFPSSVNSSQRSMSSSVAGAPREQLIFGYDENAIYADGTPVTDGTFNPFREIEQVE